MNTHRRGSLIGPILLIGAGLLFLLSNFGVIDANIWRSLLNLWPLLLIAAGLDIHKPPTMTPLNMVQPICSQRPCLTST